MKKRIAALFLAVCSVVAIGTTVLADEVKDVASVPSADSSVVVEDIKEENETYNYTKATMSVTTADKGKKFNVGSSFTLTFTVKKYSTADTGHVRVEFWKDGICYAKADKPVSEFATGTTKYSIYSPYNLPAGTYEVRTGVCYTGNPTAKYNISVVVPSTHVHSFSDGYCKCGTTMNGFCYHGYFQNYGYYVAGKLQSTKTGIVKSTYNSNWYYVEKGLLKRVSGITKKAAGTDTKWYYVYNGIYTTASGITKKAAGTDTKWYFVKDGVYTQSTGICRKTYEYSDSNYYFVQNGVFTKNTGIAKSATSATDTNWYYVRNGVKNTTATGITHKADGTSPSVWFFVKKGIYYKNAEGIAKKTDGTDGRWFFVTGGVYKPGMNVICYRADLANTTQYYVENSIFKKVTGTFLAGNYIYKVVDGVVTDKTYNY